MKFERMVNFRVLGGILVFLLIAPLFLSPYILGLLTQVLIFGLLAMSLDLLVGYVGMASLGHGAFLGVGAYSTAILVTEYGFGFWGALGFAILICMLAAALFGLVALRATGVYFLMITLALAMLVWGLAYRWSSLTKGDNGISGIPRPDLGLPWDMWVETHYFYFVLAVFLISFLLLYLLVRSPFGYSLIGIKDSESRMQSLGYNTWLNRYLAYIVAGVFGGIAGVLWSYYNGFVSPPDIELTVSVETLLMVILGGSGTLIGPVIGAAIVIFMKSYLSIYLGRWLMVLGMTYVLTVLFLPRGIYGGIEDLFQWLNRFRTGSRLKGEEESGKTNVTI